jgi:hypothetical protein
MKNYPFSDARVKRERDQNPKFRLFLNDRNNAELTQRRDVVSPDSYFCETMLMAVCTSLKTHDEITENHVAAYYRSTIYTTGSPGP